MCLTRVNISQTDYRTSIYGESNAFANIFLFFVHKYLHISEIILTHSATSDNTVKYFSKTSIVNIAEFGCMAKRSIRTVRCYIAVFFVRTDTGQQEKHIISLTY
jgi:hypothetical protein